MLELATAVELAVTAVVVEAAALLDVVGVGVVDEVSYLFTFLLVVFALVLVVDLGLDIEEGSPAVALMALAAVSLKEAVG